MTTPEEASSASVGIAILGGLGVFLGVGILFGWGIAFLALGTAALVLGILASRGARKVAARQQRHATDLDVPPFVDAPAVDPAEDWLREPGCECSFNAVGARRRPSWPAACPLHGAADKPASAP